MLKQLSRLVLVLALTVVLFGGQVWAQGDIVYYVAPNGSETNSGTSPSSPMTLKKALETAPAGATINLLGGTYRLGESVRRQVTLQPYNDETVTLKGSIVVADDEWTAEGGVWVKSGWTYQFPPPAWEDPEKYVDPAYPMANQRDQVYINGERLEQVGSQAEVSDGKFYVDYDGDRLVIGSSPAGKTVEATAFNRGIGIFGSEKSGTVVRGLTFSHYAETGVHIGESNDERAANVMIEDNTFTWNGVAGLLVGGDDAVVRGNTFRYNGRKGMGGSGDKMLVEGNLIADNNVERFKTNWDAAGIKVTRADDFTFRYNVVENNLATGLWMDISTNRATVVHNVSRGNSSIGIFFEISNKAIIAGNVATGNGAGIMVANSSKAQIYNNTVVANSTNLVVKETDRQAESWETDSTFQTQGVKVVNNLFVESEGSNDPKAMIDTWMHDHDDCANVKPMIKQFDYNGYFRTDPAQPKNLIRWVQHVSDCYQILATLTDMQSEAEIEQHGIEASGVNPFFLDTAAGDYRLQSTAPALGAGKPLPAKIALALGWQAGVPVDMGAKQYTGLLTNGSFELTSATSAKTPGGWKVKGKAKRVCNKIDRPGKPDKIFSQHLECAARLKSGGKLVQSVDVAGLQAGSVLRLEGFVSGKSVAAGGELRLKIKYQDKTKAREAIVLPTGTFDYQPVSKLVTLSALPKKVKVQAVYTGTGGKITLDVLGLQLETGSSTALPVTPAAPSVPAAPVDSGQFMR